MGIKKTLGGDRLGSGNRMKQEMHNFYRSNKNLSTTFASTMAPGILYPCYTNIALKGDTFDMDLNAFVRTIPTTGPLYGSFKLQLDVFQVPFRLYQAILHNNTTDIARKMNQVYLPKLKLYAKIKPEEYENGFNKQINESCLIKYLNMSGLGKLAERPNVTTTFTRNILAIPTLAYYEIFKNYYANQQEENAYVITPNVTIEYMQLTKAGIYQGTLQKNEENSVDNQIDFEGIGSFNKIVIEGEGLNPNAIVFNITYRNNGNQTKGTISELQTSGFLTYTINENQTEIVIGKKIDTLIDLTIFSGDSYKTNDITLTKFPLSNIDDMKKYLLTKWDLGYEAVLEKDNTQTNIYPYKAVLDYADNSMPNNTFALNGLCVKCYQSDMFNNWLDTEWVNEITENTSIDVTQGSFTLDTLNFKKKLYDHLNRLAISGGTYDDWQEATYGDRVWGKSEKPIYCGGMSAEVVFDEVISTAATQDEPLGTIGGQGQLASRKGGHVTIKVNEASVIMAIISLTPRLFYTQGNSWYNTELNTMDDLHKPIFDRIGFQDLIVENMAWWDTSFNPLSLTENNTLVVDSEMIRSSAGKQPAWLQYATDIDRAYGDFAKKEGINYMILARNYEQDAQGNVKDITTYIDPRKYNYAFAYNELDAQNFWSFVKFNIHARRKMSNTQIPNV